MVNLDSHLRVLKDLLEGDPLRCSFLHPGITAGVAAKRAMTSLRSDVDAIKWCLERGNTSAPAIPDMAQLLPDDALSNPYPPSVATTTDRQRNQHLGLGLWQLGELVRITGGSLFLWSGTAQLQRRTSGDSFVNSASWPGVLLCLILPLAKNVQEPAISNKIELDALAKRLGIDE